MSLNNDIINNWMTDIVGFAHAIESPDLCGFPAWTVKYHDSYGVAIPYNGDKDINEYFSNARVKSDVIVSNSGDEQKAIILTAEFSVGQGPFSTLCEQLIMPGNNGDNRKAVTTETVFWWQEWKELLGNRNIDERVYDTLGELCVLKYLIQKGFEANWDGPNSSTYDIELADGFVEVKSTSSRSKKEVTISNQFQLVPPGKKLSLVLCQFEPSVMNGPSIDSVVSDLISLGISKEYLNTRLSKKGFEEGMSSRKRTFILHNMLSYTVNADFPRITPASFVDGVMPAGIVKITYTVDLSGMTPEPMMQGDQNDLQNN